MIPISVPRSSRGRYTHRIAISDRRLVSVGENGITFTYKDYRIEGPGRYKTMTHRACASSCPRSCAGAAG
jgi:hypothetical protein